MPVLPNNAPQTSVNSRANSAAVFRKEAGSRSGGLCGHSHRQRVAVGLEQPAQHFHNRKGQCCGSRGFRDVNTIHSGSSELGLGSTCRLLQPRPAASVSACIHSARDSLVCTIYIYILLIILWGFCLLRIEI